MGENRGVAPGRIALLRIVGYVVAAGLLALGVSLGGGAGTVLLVLGLVLVAALVLTFRLR